MPKTKQKAASNQARGPVSSQAAGFGVSGAVRDLPTAMPAQPREPREINPQNTIPIKSVKPNASPPPANPAARKKRSVRPTRGKKPV